MYQKETAPGMLYDIYEDVQEFLAAIPTVFKTYTDKGKKYLYLCSGFDIETTLYKRHSYMYHGQWSVGRKICLFRKWSDFDAIYKHLLSIAKRHKATVIVWVANLGYEFSYICHRIKISRVFAKQERHPITVTSGKIQFRDCLSVSGQGGLANLAKNYCITRKLAGDLDYTGKLRNSYTQLSDKEKAYCINDVAILSEWAQYCYDRWIHNDDGHIPLTITGICRESVKAAAGRNLPNILKLVNYCYPKTAEMYSFMMRFLFRGGFTHANICHVGREVENVVGVDYTSSYPAVMMHYQYPCSPFIPCQLETDGVQIIDDKLDNKAVWMIVELYGVEAKTFHSIESEHKIIQCYNADFDNGRLHRAEYLRIALTELDYEVYEMFYRWKRLHIVQAWCAKKGPLPDYLIKPLMEAYQAKTRLKRSGQDETVEYKNAKTIVNSFYGMTVTRLSFTDWTFKADRVNAKGEPEPWYEVKEKKPYWKMIQDQFLLPQWGIWVTAYARWCLLSCVAEMDNGREAENVVYCDTDSIYFIDTPANRAVIERWNAGIRHMNECFPVEFDDIGCFDYIEHGMHYHFKTLGAKRYIKLDENGRTTVTVAGMRKGTYERAISTEEPPDGSYVYVDIKNDDGSKERRYMSTDDFFDRFDDMLLLSADQACKLAALYHDSPYSAVIDGEEMHELSGCALVNITFMIKLDRIWLKEAFALQRKLRREDI